MPNRNTNARRTRRLRSRRRPVHLIKARSAGPRPASSSTRAPIAISRLLRHSAYRARKLQPLCVSHRGGRLARPSPVTGARSRTLAPMRRDKPRRRNALEGGAGPGSGRTAQVVLQALAAGPQGAQMRAKPARTMALQTTAEMVAPAAAYDRAVRNRWRGSIDARAVRARFSDPVLHDVSVQAVERPRSSFHCWSRCGPRRSVRACIPACATTWKISCMVIGCGARPEANVRMHGTWVETFALLTRAAMGAPLPPEARVALAPHWRRWMTREELAATEGLGQLVAEPGGVCPSGAAGHRRSAGY